jgi:hypothetical protein
LRLDRAIEHSDRARLIEGNHPLRTALVWGLACAAASLVLET